VSLLRFRAPLQAVRFLTPRAARQHGIELEHGAQVRNNQWDYAENGVFRRYGVNRVQVLQVDCLG
jgi:hypothetical protein